MSQPEKPTLHKISLKARKPEQGLTPGSTTEILLDGIPVKGVTFFKLELKPRKIAKITLELVGNLEDFEIDGDYEVRESRK